MQFEKGEQVSYHPRVTKLIGGEHSLHFEATITGFSKRGRPRIEYQVEGGGVRKATVSVRALTRQGLLAV